MERLSEQQQSSNNSRHQHSRPLQQQQQQQKWSSSNSKAKARAGKMGSLWRSEEMNLVQLYVQYDAAHDTFDELGELGLVQFHDVCDPRTPQAPAGV